MRFFAPSDLRYAVFRAIGAQSSENVDVTVDVIAASRRTVAAHVSIVVPPAYPAVNAAASMLQGGSVVELAAPALH